MPKQEMNSQVADILCCSCTQQIFFKPVSVNCGHIFEEEFIKDYIAKSEKSKCPECREHINIEGLRRVYKLEEIIENFLLHNPRYYSEQYFPGQTISNFVFKNKITELVNFFKPCPKRINETLSSNEIVLNLAVRLNREEMVQALLHHFKNEIDINAVNNVVNKTQIQTQTPLLLSITNNNFTLFTLLLNNGAYPHLAAKGNLTPLLVAMAYHRAAMIDVLLALDQDLNVNQALTADFELSNTRLPMGNTTLHFAIQFTTTDQFKKLLLKNVDVNIRNNQGKTPLMLAVENNEYEKVKLLLTMPNIDVLSRQYPVSNNCILDALKTTKDRRIKNLFESPTAQIALFNNYIFAADYDGIVEVLAEAYLKNNELFTQLFQKLDVELIKEVMLRFCHIKMNEIIKNDDLTLLKTIEKYDSELLTCEEQYLRIMGICIQHGSEKIFNHLLEHKQLERNNNANTIAGSQFEALLVEAAKSTRITQTMLTNLLNQGVKPCIRADTISPIFDAISKHNDLFIHCYLNSSVALSPDLPVKTGDFKGQTELNAIVAYGNADMLRLLIQTKGKFINPQQDKSVFSETLNLCFQKNDIEKLMLLMELPSFYHFLEKNSEQILSWFNKNERTKQPIAQFLMGFYFFQRLAVSDKVPDSILMDHVFTLKPQLINFLTEITKIPVKIKSFIENFIALLQSEIQNNAKAWSEMSDEQVKLLNHLFLFAHQTYYKNSFNWEKQIRYKAMQIFLNLPNTIETNTFLAGLKTQPIVSTPRFFITLGPTKSVKQLDSFLTERQLKLS